MHGRQVPKTQAAEPLDGSSPSPNELLNSEEEPPDEVTVSWLWSRDAEELAPLVSFEHDLVDQEDSVPGRDTSSPASSYPIALALKNSCALTTGRALAAAAAPLLVDLLLLREGALSPGAALIAERSDVGPCAVVDPCAVVLTDALRKTGVASFTSFCSSCCFFSFISSLLESLAFSELELLPS
mmetsp:Transcript_80987/g.208479  ORF Transcript_80987/g.208479 Transcript_80987/m.208479 type:complete len:184 (+) Transcript_80987:668-1219(+)